MEEALQELCYGEKEQREQNTIWEIIQSKA